MSLHNDFHMAEFRERERRLRIAAERHRLSPHAPSGLRLRLGGLLMRLGRAIAGEVVGRTSITTHASKVPLG